MTNAKRLLKNQVSALELIEKLLVLSEDRPLCLLDSGGVSYLESRYLIGGFDPLEIFEISSGDPESTLRFLDEQIENLDTFAIFTISYDFGLKLEKIEPREKSFSHPEPDVFLAVYDCLIVHDYETGETFLIGRESRFDELEKLLESAPRANFPNPARALVRSNFTKPEYLAKIAEIKEFIRRGDTYQTNLTQQFTAELPGDLTPAQIFHNLRRNHPAAFASFVQRTDSTVISASPERFFRVRGGRISTSPIKGTRPRGKTPAADRKLMHELLNSAKDRAENVMIVDLLRNDLGRICDFGSVSVERLCALETHPTLFHLVSTVAGELRPATKFSEIIRAVFPCGSITGAPKIRTMQLIDRLETANRGLSMGAIGYKIPNPGFRISDSETAPGAALDLSVAIRTMTIKNRRAIFNVGGGIVIDSVPADEYAETLTKARALLLAINGRIEGASEKTEQIF